MKSFNIVEPSRLYSTGEDKLNNIRYWYSDPETGPREVSKHFYDLHLTNFFLSKEYKPDSVLGWYN